MMDRAGVHSPSWPLQGIGRIARILRNCQCQSPGAAHTLLEFLV